MSYKLPFVLACAMAGVVIGLYAWDFSVDILEHEQTAPVIYEFNPPRKEFKLDDGTPCVMVWAPQRAQAVGVVCNWRHNEK